MCLPVTDLHLPVLLPPSPQQLLREMQQMASRPFATINVALETDEEPPDLIGGNVKVSATFSHSDHLTNPGDLIVFRTDRIANRETSSII